MILRVRVIWIACALLISSAANADAYSFFSVSNGGWSVNETHAKTAYQACLDTLHSPFDATLTRQVVGTRFEPITSTCRMYLDDKSQASIVVSSVAGSCAGDVSFSFENQRCLDEVTLEDQFAVALATFLWLSLIGGILVGFKVAA